MLGLIQTYRNFILQAILSVFLTLVLTFVRIPAFFLTGLCTYVLPENLGQNGASGGVKAAIRRPSSSDDPKTSAEVKRRNRSKEKFEFDESSAQIFRIKLDDDHLRSRLYFKEYNNCFFYSFLAVSCFMLHKYLGVDENLGILANGLMVPIVFGVVALCKVFIVLAKAAIERSASKNSEKRLSLIMGVLGFVFGFITCAGVIPNAFDFKFGSIDGSWCVFISFLTACIMGFLYMPAGRSARAFWIGTDQIRCNLSIVSCGWFSRMILYANYIVAVFTSLLWVHPFADLLRKGNGASRMGVNQRLVGNVGMPPSDFVIFRVCCLLLCGLLHIMAVRPNLQMFLNEAVLSWYQRLHASKVPDLDFSRAKMFLHNHYLCLVLIQFFAPPLLVLLFLGSSQINGNSFGLLRSVCGSLTCGDFAKELGLFMAWWVVLVWSVFASSSLLFYRRGILYVS